MCSRKEGIGKTWEQKQRPYRKAKHEVPDDKMFPSEHMEDVEHAKRGNG